jgi:hypothetical protein
MVHHFLNQLLVEIICTEIVLATENLSYFLQKALALGKQLSIFLGQGGGLVHPDGLYII